MRKNNPLKPFHAGVPIDDTVAILPWLVTREEFHALIPDRIITSQNRDCVSLNCTVLTVPDEFHFIFIPPPNPVFHEIHVYDQDPESMNARHALFANAIKGLLGEPTWEYEKHIVWHDQLLVLDLSLAEARDRPEGPKFPLFLLSFQNSERCARHCNNSADRRPGLEQ